MNDILIKVDGVSKKFCKSLKKSLKYGLQDLGSEFTGSRHGGNGKLRPDEFWAVNDVSFELRRGECLGLIGRNGAGKTTLLRMLNGLIKPDHGKIEMRGRVGALIALGAGFNPILSGRENIYVNASVLGLTKKEIDAKMDEIIDFAEIDEFIDTPVQNYSSGMQVRLGFAVAIALNPDVLLLDEVLAVGDAAFRTKCFQRIGKLLNNCAVIFVSHDTVQVSRICDQCLYLKKGENIAIGRTEIILDRYRSDTPAIVGVKSVVKDQCVSSFAILPTIIETSWGEIIRITLHLEMEPKYQLGLCLLTLMEGEISVSQSDVTEQINSGLLIGSELTVTLGPIQLRQGLYNLAVTILNESKKSTVVHALNCAQIRINGDQGYGVPYQLSATVRPV